MTSGAVGGAAGASPALVLLGQQKEMNFPMLWMLMLLVSVSAGHVGCDGR